MEVTNIPDQRSMDILYAYTLFKLSSIRGLISIDHLFLNVIRILESMILSLLMEIIATKQS